MLSAVRAPAHAASFTRRAPTEVALSYLRNLGPAEPHVEDLVRGLPEVPPIKAGNEILGEREAGRPRILVGGWAARTRLLPDGRRQIFSLVLPGESIGVSLRPRPLAVGALISLTPCQQLDAGAMQTAVDSLEAHWAGLRDRVHLSSSLCELYLHNQILRLGRLSAHERMCHLLLELQDRLALAGIGDGRKFPMPLTQETLADVTGLSVVHVNRILQQLRREGLLELYSGQVHLMDREALETIADYRSPLANGRSVRRLS